MRERFILCAIVLFLISAGANAITDTLLNSTASESKVVHRVEAEFRPSYVLPTHEFFEGVNAAGKPINMATSFHLKYSSRFAPETYLSKIYGNAYQGIGLARFDFGNREEVGIPIAVYLFQGAQIARLSPRVSLNYEWNFGLSLGWIPHDYETNMFNRVVGSKKNAYINVNLYLAWILSRHIDLNAGVDIAHFSNGNTDFPNGGVNYVGAKVGLVYNFNRKRDFISDFSPDRSDIPEFRKHINYDLVIFGALRRRGALVDDRPVALPNLYNVLGFSFSPMYNCGYNFKFGLSLDGFYDGSANLQFEDYIPGTPPVFSIPPIKNQLALGISARAEFVMPYFTICLGGGVHVIHGGGNIKSTYQIFALKAHLTRNTFLHFGYSLCDFNNPNFLMMGIGYRFNNQYPVIR